MAATQNRNGGPLKAWNPDAPRIRPSEAERALSDLTCKLLAAFTPRDERSGRATLYTGGALVRDEATYLIGDRVVNGRGDAGRLIGGTEENAIIALDAGGLAIDEWTEVQRERDGSIGDLAATFNDDLDELEALCRGWVGADTARYHAAVKPVSEDYKRSIGERIAKLCAILWPGVSNQTKGAR